MDLYLGISSILLGTVTNAGEGRNRFKGGDCVSSARGNACAQLGRRGQNA